RAPHFDDLEQDFRARFINGFSWIGMTLLIAVTIIISVTGFTDYTVYVLIGLIVVFALTIFLLKKRLLNLSALVLVVLTWIGIFFQAYTADGIHDVIMIGFIATALFASILIGWWAGGITILASILAAWLLASFEINQLITPTVSTPFTFARDLTFILMIISALIYFSTTNLQNAIARAKESEKKLYVSNENLHKLNLSLEDRIAESTAELVVTNRRNERRAKQFEAIAQVARVIATVQDMDSLLPRVTQVISQQFGFYHVGIFLWDDNREYAVLMAANSEGGQRMLRRGHKLGIGQTGIVGFVAATGASRVALDVGADAVYFSNPDLPNTRSELALPLRVANEVIGVLDVQSTEQNVFQEEDTEVLATLADQVAIAIQNGHSYEKTQQLLKEAQKTSGEYLRDSWRILQSREEYIGYLMSDNTLKPLNRPVTSDQIDKAISTREHVAESGKTATLAVPIRLRDEVIGIIDIHTTDQHIWDSDEVDIAEAVAERLSLALETSLLLQTTQRRAQIERATSEISGKISSSTQFDSILRTAAEELSRILGGSEVLVQIQPGSIVEEAN
ncbi:MAG TPA: GAF domain-containing protein, partial [Anaerolineales bacterium]|nr:GAF domain-containing protein [Anaerolineales bacterium]